jgi:hypothetical protein
VILHLLGLIAIVAWNLYSVQRLLGCLESLPINKQGLPPEGTATLGKVAWYALGRNGLYALDVMMVMLLCGIIITYEGKNECEIVIFYITSHYSSNSHDSSITGAILSFLEGTPFSTGTLTLDAIGISVLIGLLSIVPDMGYLTKASATGLTVLFITFSVIAWYGDYKGMAWNWWPQDGMSGVSTWFGCVVFGFGVVPLTFNMQEAMEEPSRMIGASFQGFSAVAVTYAILGLGLLLLYPDVDGDVLQELPTTGILPTAVRLAMVVVVMVTAPLLVVPCGELLEGKIQIVVPAETTMLMRVFVRLSICVLCSFISVFVPGFVNVLSFVGCFCVALVSFVVPPLLHVVLLEKSANNTVLTKRARLLDLVMLVWGISATIITSVYTFRKMGS